MEETVEGVGERGGRWEFSVLWGQLFCKLKTALKIKSITSRSPSLSSTHVNACSFFLTLSFAVPLPCRAIRCPGHGPLPRGYDRCSYDIMMLLPTPSFSWGPLSGTQCPVPVHHSQGRTFPLISRDFSQIPPCCSCHRGEEFCSLGRRTQSSREFW